MQQGGDAVGRGWAHVVGGSGRDWAEQFGSCRFDREPNIGNLVRSFAHDALDVVSDFRKAVYGELTLGECGSHAKKAATVENVDALKGKRSNSE